MAEAGGMTRCLVTYASTDDRTAKIANRIAADLHTIGVRVDLRTTSEAKSINVHHYELAVVGTSPARFSASLPAQDTPAVQQSFAADVTDWAAVDAFAFQIADLLPVPAPA
jgi:menaquinone-dependent protoporphyrinogen IX oxidase